MSCKTGRRLRATGWAQAGRTASVSCVWILVLSGMVVGSATAAKADRLAVRSTSEVQRLMLDGSVELRETAAEIHQPQLVAVPNSETVLVTWREVSAGSQRSFFTISLDGNTYIEPRETSYELRLRYGDFEPRTRVPEVAAALRANDDNDLYIVQFITQPAPALVAALESVGADVYAYLADHAYIVRLDEAARNAIDALPFVRWVGPYHPAYRLEESLQAGLSAGASLPQARYNIQVLAPGAALKATLGQRLRGAGAAVDWAPGGSLMTAELTAEQLQSAAAAPEVLFIDRWHPPEADMNIARSVSGANVLESVAGYTGTGVRGEVIDGNVLESHIDFASRPLILHGTKSGDADHGTPTTGIIFGDGTGSSTGRGLLPSGQGIFADYNYLFNRYDHTQALLGSPYYAVFQSNSWGSGLTTSYTSTTWGMDEIVFDLDILICQSQSNEGTQDSRPQAWAKNLVSVGGVFHGDTATRTDDVWGYGASIGPAADGRVKPDLCHFYDWIYCPSDSGGYTSTFGGTSGATPIVAGYFGLLFEMWADGVFGNEVSGGTVFEERPHAATAKALMINAASQYPFVGSMHDLTRTHQGWGMPDVARLHDWAGNTYVIDESQPLSLSQVAQYTVLIVDGIAFHDELRATMVYTDPPGTISSSQHRINDLTLKVISPTGTVFYGNNGLLDGNWSTPGGSPNTIDTVENVFIANPEEGRWTIEVRADEINQDGHPETPQFDADFALVVSGGVGGADCNGNQILDDCDVDCGLPECNVPGCGMSADCNGNGFPDECEVPDCNGNEVPDECELVGNDCNADEVPDDCQLVGNDCNANFNPDDCDEAAFAATIAGPLVTLPCVGGGGELSVMVPDATAHQWYKDGIPLDDGGHYAGTSTATLSIANADVGDEGTYHCAVYQGCIHVLSAPVELDLVPSTLTVTQQPVASVTLCTASGQGAVFETAVDDPFGATYRWSRDGLPLVDDAVVHGSHTARLEIDLVGTEHLGTYTCHIENDCGASVDTDPNRGRLVVADAVYAEQPADACTPVGGSASFSVGEASPPGVLVFWFRDDEQLADGTDANGMQVSGATTDTVELSNVPALYDQSEFYVIGVYPSPVCYSYSEVGLLTVGPGCLPPCAAADTDCNGLINAGDILVIRSGLNWNKPVSEAADPRGDVDGNGLINAGDILVIRSGLNWNTSTGPCICDD